MKPEDLHNQVRKHFDIEEGSLEDQMAWAFILAGVKISEILADIKTGEPIVSLPKQPSGTINIRSCMIATASVLAPLQNINFSNEMIKNLIAIFSLNDDSSKVHLQIIGIYSFCRSPIWTTIIAIIEEGKFAINIVHLHSKCPPFPHHHQYENVLCPLSISSFKEAVGV